VFQQEIGGPFSINRPLFDGRSQDEGSASPVGSILFLGEVAEARDFMLTRDFREDWFESSMGALKWSIENV
jgi:hypothetical protein